MNNIIPTAIIDNNKLT